MLVKATTALPSQDYNDKAIDKTINNLLKIEDTFTEMETKLDQTINKIIIAKITKEMNEEINFIN